MSKPTNEEILDVSSILESKCSIFRQFWDIGAPNLVEDEIPRAAIAFDKSGVAVNFMWNEEFWKEADTYTRAFITAHEMLHILLNHGMRMLIHKNDINSNKAMDIVVNHLLVNEFGFDRDKLNIKWQDYCWVETLFEPNDRPATNKSYEYYYNLLEKIDVPDKLLMDSHGIIGDSSEDVSDSLSNSIDSGDISDHLKQIIMDNSLSSNMFAGTALGQKINILNKKVKVVKKWEEVITPSYFKKVYKKKTLDSWTKDSRRMYEFLNSNSDVYLQSNVEVEGIFKDKIYSHIWFFMDYSGSCVSYYQTFLDAARSLNKKNIKVTLYTFDTNTYEVKDGSSSATGGGGTNFSCILNRVESLLKSGEDEPTAIFVITDGWSSDTIYPTTPEKWHWFLTNKSTEQHIPKNSVIHSISDFMP